MKTTNWTQQAAFAITVCDVDGLIIEMNEKACETFIKYGGAELIGTNVLDCHTEPSRSMLAEMMRTQQSHTYTIEKRGRKKLIHQTPWYEDGKYMGFVEISFELPDPVPNQVKE